MLSLRRLKSDQHLLISVFIFLSVSFDQEKQRISCVEGTRKGGENMLTNFHGCKVPRNLFRHGQRLNLSECIFFFEDFSVNLLVPFIDIHRPFFESFSLKIYKET